MRLSLSELNQKTKTDLQELAESLTLDTLGTKDELVVRLNLFYSEPKFITGNSTMLENYVDLPRNSIVYCTDNSHRYRKTDDTSPEGIWDDLGVV